ATARDMRELQVLLAGQVGGAPPQDALPVLDERAPVAELELLALEYEEKGERVRHQLEVADRLRERWEEGEERLRQGQWAEAVAALDDVVQALPQHVRAREALDRARGRLAEQMAEAARRGVPAGVDSSELVSGAEAGDLTVERPREAGAAAEPGELTVMSPPEALRPVPEAGESTVLSSPETLQRAGSVEAAEQTVLSPPDAFRAFARAKASERSAASPPPARPPVAAPEVAERDASRQGERRPVGEGAGSVPAAPPTSTRRRVRGRNLALASAAVLAALALAYGLLTTAKSRRLEVDLRQASQQTAAARVAALGGEANLLAGEMFDRAAARERDGERLAKAGQVGAAIAALREAEQGYASAGRASGEARAVRTKADQARDRMLAEKQRAPAGTSQYEEALTREAAGEDGYRARAFQRAADNFSAAARLFALSTPPPPAPAPPAPAAPTAPPPEPNPDADIRALLRLYSRAFETKDLRLLQQIRPGLRPDELRRHREVFDQTRSYRLNLKVDAIKVNGDTAEARGRREDVVVTNDGQTVRTPDDFLFRFKRSNDRWTIEAVK
ncbi:MAG TPA: hypothetical protein VEL75_14480, partial [Candidatus Methylomirabilis sp.]|nr:hypothetical protein [Candidatus Methylomirabilis sp.]